MITKKEATKILSKEGPVSTVVDDGNYFVGMRGFSGKLQKVPTPTVFRAVDKVTGEIGDYFPPDMNEFIRKVTYAD